MRWQAVALFLFAIAHVLGTELGDAVISNIARVPIESSVLASVGYSRQAQILEVEFRNGAIYRYLEVPETVFHELMSADSKTSYYDVNIRGRYRSLHVQPPR